MNTIEDVRAALYDAYMLYKKYNGYIDGKSDEGLCQLIYPTIYDCNSSKEFITPTGIMVYSYTLGPSRRHYFFFGEESHPDYNIWYSKNIYDTAVHEIMNWIDEVEKNYQIERRSKNEL